MTDAAATATADPAAAATEARDNAMPKGIPFIVANEFAERFCYYGINAILTVYLVQSLHFGEAGATRFSSFFQAGAYIFPLVGAFVSDVFWGKYRTIMSFSLVYATGCAVVALVPGVAGLSIGLFFVALGTGGIKPCVSTNVGDQFTSKNQHLIERAFSYFYFAINAGSSISIFLCPVLLDPFDPEAKPRFIADFLIRSGIHGRIPAFGMPAVMMFFATLVFWMGRGKFAVVPPAGKAWLEDTGLMWVWQRLLRPAFAAVGIMKRRQGETTASVSGLKVIGSLAIIYLFVAVFWSLWNQSNGQTWTLQARSSLMDKDLGFGFTILPAQIQVVNGLYILGMIPIFTFGVYPLWAKLTKVTPLRKMAVGFFVAASSFVMVSRVEAHIQAGESVSAWWQILAYGVLSAAEVLVSITALEFSYKQAPLKMKSFIMAMFLLSSALGSLLTAGVNKAMVRPLHATAIEAGAQTWVTLDDVTGFVTGQKIDFDGDNGIVIAKDGQPELKDGKPVPLKGTFLVGKIDEPSHRLELSDVVDRKPVATSGTYVAASSDVSTYRLVGPQYFNFFAGLMSVVGLLFILVAVFYKEKTHVREEAEPQKA
jgi:POT family proton-dependent oligopeptide transporter